MPEGEVRFPKIQSVSSRIQRSETKPEPTFSALRLISTFWAVLKATYIQVLVCGIYCGAIFVPDQSKELVEIIWEGGELGGTSALYQILATFVAFGIFTVLLFAYSFNSVMNARHLAANMHVSPDARELGQRFAAGEIDLDLLISRGFARAYCLFLSVLPGLALILMIITNFQIGFSVRYIFMIISTQLIALAVAIAVERRYSVLLSRHTQKLAAKSFFSRTKNNLLYVAAPIYWISIYLTMLGILASSPLALNGFGPLYIWTVFAIIILVLFSAISFGVGYVWVLRRRTAFPIPVLGTIAVVGFLANITDTNDRHEIGTSKPATEARDRSALEVGEEFERWVNSQLPGRSKKLEPVFFLAAQGGGLYAGYHAAYALASLTQSVPGFADRLFAISAVSGGGVGSAAYLSLLESERLRDRANMSGCRHNWAPAPTYLSSVEKIFREDYLSPLLGRLLLTDIPLNMIPFSGALPIDDRGRLLGEAIADAVDRSAGDKLVSPANWLLGPALHTERLSDFSNRCSNEGPHLLLNATLVETGQRVVMAPFLVYGSVAPPPAIEFSGAWARWVAFNSPAIDFPKGVVITRKEAVSISARFPIITPPASVPFARNGEAHKYRLVDGGYSDNSGIKTLIDIFDKLAPTMARLGIKPYVIVLSHMSGGEPVHYAFGDIGSVLRAANRARIARGVGAVAELKSKLVDVCQVIGDSKCTADSIQEQVIEFHVTDDVTRSLTLGWYLSDTTREKVRSKVTVDLLGRVARVVHGN